MTIRIRAFAIYRELLGRDVIDLEFPSDQAAPLTPDEVFAHLFGKRADRARLLRSTMFAVNREYVDGKVSLQAGDELALIPPVAGGAST